MAVVCPASPDDVVQIIRQANERKIPVAIRGQGHSRWGQTLAQDGIVIDTSVLNRVIVASSAAADVQAGAFWNDLFTATLTRGFTPPAMGTCPWLSIGGLLSAGGFSNSSHLYGAIADTSEELDVVTGSGELVTCSREQNCELYDMVLAGMGLCACIVRARIRLIPAPSTVVRQDLYYDDLDDFLTDGKRLVLRQTGDRFQHLTSRATQRADGRWIFSINIGRFYGPGEEPEWTLVKERMYFQNKAEPVRASYFDYLNRESAKNTADAASRANVPRREPSLTCFIPFSAARSFITELFADPANMAGLADFQLNPFHVRLAQRPMFRFPDEDVAYMVWLYPRNVPMEDRAAYERVLEINQRILERMRAVGGKSYPPYAPYATPEEWQEHYGPEMWPRLIAAKRKYDPNNILTPGISLFDGSARTQGGSV
jgi:FAD/FMN-containing dehydrogenase